MFYSRISSTLPVSTTSLSINPGTAPFLQPNPLVFAASTSTTVGPSSSVDRDTTRAAFDMSLKKIRARTHAAASDETAQRAIVARLWAQLYHFRELSAAKG